MTTMIAPRTNPQWFQTLFGGLRDGLKLLNAARECAAAVEAHRQPPAQALKILGINEVAFREIYKH